MAFPSRGLLARMVNYSTSRRIFTQVCPHRHRHFVFGTWAVAWATCQSVTSCHVMSVCHACLCCSGVLRAWLCVVCCVPRAAPTQGDVFHSQQGQLCRHPNHSANQAAQRRCVPRHSVLRRRDFRVHSSCNAGQRHGGYRCDRA